MESHVIHPTSEQNTNVETMENPVVSPRAEQNETAVEVDVVELETSTNGNPNLVNVESQCTRFFNDMRQSFCSFKQNVKTAFESC